MNSTLNCQYVYYDRSDYTPTTNRPSDKRQHTPSRLSVHIAARQLKIDKTFSFAIPSTPFNIVLKWEELAGPSRPSQCNGDMMHAIKVMRLIRSTYPLAQIFLCPYFIDEVESTPSDSCHPLNPDRFSLIPGHDNSIVPEHLGVLSPRLIPEYIRHCCDGPTLLFDLATPRNGCYPFSWEQLEACVHVDEYNGGRIHKASITHPKKEYWWSSGLGTDSTGLPTVGIHITDSLAGAKTSITEIEQLADRQLLEHIQRPNVSDRKREFYFGYLSPGNTGNALERFCYSVTHYELSQGEDRDIDFLVLQKGQTHHFENKDWVVHKLTKTFAEHFNSIEFIDTTGRYLFYPNPFSSKTKRNLRFILWGNPIPHQDYIRLLTCTGIAVLTTGDQSLAEALSLRDRAIFYECMPWKEDLFGQMIQLAPRLLSLFYRQQAQMRCTISGFRVPTNLDLQRSKYLGRSTLISQQKQFAQFVAENFNYDEWLKGCISRILSTSPQAACSESKMVHEVTIQTAPHRMRLLGKLRNMVS